MCEMCRTGFSRRGFLAGAAAAGAAALMPSSASAQAGLPARGEFVIRNAYVMTMDPALGDIAGGAVHVRNGEIIAVAKEIAAPGAQVIDGEGMVVLPGLIETH